MHDVIIIGGGPAGLQAALTMGRMRHDVLPDVPGLGEIWGVEAAQCPFCHGYEVADRAIAILGTNGHIGMYASMLSCVSRDLVLLTDGEGVDDTNAAIIAGLGGRIVSTPVLGVERAAAGVRIALDGADPIDVAGVFVGSVTFEQSAPFAQQLGLALLPSGAIEIDVWGNTSVPGVYAAGDLAHVAALPMPMPALATSIAAGLVAGASCVRDLLDRR